MATFVRPTEYFEVAETGAVRPTGDAQPWHPPGNGQSRMLVSVGAVGWVVAGLLVYMSIY